MNQKIPSNVGNLTKFLIELGQDPARIEELKSNPKRLVEEAQLSPQATDALLRGDAASLVAMVEPDIASAAAAGDTVVVVVVVVVV